MKRFVSLFQVVVCSLVLSFAARAQDTFRGNLAHTGVYSSSGLPKFSSLKWKFHTNGQVFSSPAVSGDTLFAGSSDHHLYAVDLASGAQKWKFKAGGRITSSPAVF